VVRTEAAQLCYPDGPGLWVDSRHAGSVIPAHGGVGIVIEVGSTVGAFKWRPCHVARSGELVCLLQLPARAAPIIV